MDKMKFNKKLLIYVEERDLKPTGGASGYNYNLSQGLKDIQASNYYYLNSPTSAKDVMHSLKDTSLKRLLFIFFRIANVYKILHKKSNFARTDLNKFEIVHFHSSKDLYESRSSLEGYQGKVVLTCHQPKPYTFEFIEDVITPFERKYFSKFYLKMLSMEEYAFNRADYIVFPCPEAEEPYFQKWDKYSKIHADNKDKYRYLLTSKKKSTYKIEKDTYRKSLSIGRTDFVVTFVGRHNSTKGYDVLKKIGKDLSHSSIQFLIAGKEDPLKGLDQPNWHEVGWTNDPGSVINASDLFILPNKSTYFDLVLLEVLSLGKIVLASRTGGNKFFERIEAHGVILFDDVAEAEAKISEIQSMSDNQRIELGKANYELYEKYFSNSVFAHNYVNLINSLE